MKIFIDAGHNHNGHDTGALGFGLREQDFNWEVASRLAAILRLLGFQVRESRPNFTDNLGTTMNTSLSARSNMSNQWGADYFVSIHANAGGGTGAETFAFSPSSRGAGLAGAIQRNIIRDLGIRDRGVKFANFAVLRATNAPAVLVECAFIDNQNDNKILRTRQDDFARAIAKGICEFTGIIYREDEIMTTEQALDILVQKGVINSPDYWLKVADVVNHFPQLLINMAND